MRTASCGCPKETQRKHRRGPSPPISQETGRTRMTRSPTHFRSAGSTGSVMRCSGRKAFGLRICSRFPIDSLASGIRYDAVGLPLTEINSTACGSRQRTLVSRLLKFEKCFRARSATLRTDLPGWLKTTAATSLITVHRQDSDSGNGASRRSNTEPFIRRICHAMAIDDRRYMFHPTLYLESQPGVTRAGTSIRQVWFPGVHANVGGGYPKMASPMSR